MKLQDFIDRAGNSPYLEDAIKQNYLFHSSFVDGVEIDSKDIVIENTRVTDLSLLDDRYVQVSGTADILNMTTDTCVKHSFTSVMHRYKQIIHLTPQYDNP